MAGAPGVIVNKKTGERGWWDGEKVVPIPQQGANVLDIPVGRIIRGPNGERKTWDGSKWVDYDPIARPFEIARTGAIEGGASLLSAPQAVGSKMAAIPDAASIPFEFPGQRAAFSAAGDWLSKNVPNYEEFVRRGTINTGGEPLVQPQEASGRLLKSTVAGITAAAPFAPFAPIAAPIGGALSGAASQGVAEFNGPPWLQTVAGIGAPLLAGGIGASVRAMAPAAEKQLTQALATVTKDELLAAEKLMQMSQGKIPLTWGMALNQVTGGRFGNLARLEQVVEQSSGGRALQELSMRRLQDTRGQLQQNLENVGPMPQGDELRAVPHKVSEAANATVREAEKVRTAASRPYYQAANPDYVPANDMQIIISELDDAIAHAGDGQVKVALARLREDLTTQAGAMSPRVPQTRIQELSNTVKAWQDRINPNPNMPLADVSFANKALKGTANPILKKIDDLIGTNSAAYQKGQEVYKAASEQVVKPTQRSIAGEIAGQATPDLDKQIATLLPLGKQGTVDPASVTGFIKDVARTDPDAARNLMRAGLASEFDNVMREFATAGVSPNRSASLYASIAGNPTRRASMRAAVTALPNGEKAWAGFEKMLQMLDATRYRLPAGSDTAFKQETIRALEGKGIPLSIEDVNPASFFTGEIKELGKARRYRLNSETIANILVDPSARVRLMSLANLEPNSREAMRLLAGILATSTTQPDQPLSK